MKTSKLKFNGNIILIAFAVFMLVNLIMNPKLAVSSVMDGIKLWFYNVMPSLFPYMIFGSILFQLNASYIFQRLFNKPMSKIFNISGSGILAIVMGYLSGYPLGAKLVADLRKEDVISLKESYKLLAMCSTTGPAFIVGTIATQMFDNSAIIPVLLIANYGGSIVNGIVLKHFYKEDIPVNRFKKGKVKHFSDILNSSIVDAIHSVVKICGYMVFFNLVIIFLDDRDILDLFTNFFSQYLNVFQFSDELIKGLFYGLFEITLGINTICQCSDPLMVKVVVTALITAWSGLSIHMQTNSFFVGTDIKYSRFFLGKVSQTILSTVLAIISYGLLYPTVLSVYNSLHIGQVFAQFQYPTYYAKSIAILTLVALLLWIYQKKTTAKL